MTWQHRLIVSKLAEGCLVREAAAAAGIHRQTFWRWLNASPDFAEVVRVARAVGEAERRYRSWLRHPFRGKRPPTGRGHGGRPQFSWGRR